MELEQVDRLHPEVAPAVLGVLDDMVGRKHVLDPVPSPGRPAEVSRRHLRRGAQAAIRVAPDEPAQDALAGAVAVAPGGVEERAAEVDRELKRPTCFDLVGARPACHAPHPDPELRDLPARAPEAPRPHPLPPRVTWTMPRHISSVVPSPHRVYRGLRPAAVSPVCRSDASCRHVTRSLSPA